MAGDLPRGEWAVLTSNQLFHFALLQALPDTCDCLALLCGLPVPEEAIIMRNERETRDPYMCALVDHRSAQPDRQLINSF